MSNEDTLTPVPALRRARQILESHDLLGRLTPAEMDEVLQHAHTQRLAPNQLLFAKGDPGDGLFAVLSGQIKISTLSESGKEVVLNILGPGEIFGEIALLDGKARTANAHAIGASELLVLPRLDFLRFLERHPQVNRRLLEVLCARLRWVSESYEDVVFKRLANRLAKKLAVLAEHFGEAGEGGGVTIALPLPQQELANMVGATRESVNKQMRLWEDAGLIAYDQGRITVLDLARLAEIAESEEDEAGQDRA
jgi:CRP-like cAMP-binding protein